MYRVAYRIVGQSADAEEVRQTILLRMIQRPELLPQASRIAAWIRRRVVNESISLVRKRRRESQLEVGNELPAHFAEPSGDSGQLHTLLGKLEPSQRALLALRFDEQLTVREIAEVTETPRSTVHDSLQSAIDVLREHYESSELGDIR